MQCYFSQEGLKPLNSTGASAEGSFTNIAMSGQDVFRFAVRAVPSVRHLSHLCHMSVCVSFAHWHNTANCCCMALATKSVRSCAVIILALLSNGTCQPLIFVVTHYYLLLYSLDQCFDCISHRQSMHHTAPQTGQSGSRQLKHLHNVEARFCCPQTFLYLRRDDVSALCLTFWD